MIEKTTGFQTRVYKRKGVKMLTQDRKNKILELIGESGSVSVAELTQKLGASEATIRRDLSALANLGKINKVHGGATLPSHEYLNLEAGIHVKVQSRFEEKSAIAAYAASLIQDEDYVFLDAGSTTFLMSKMIQNSKATFVTNGISHARELAQKGCKVIILGGELKDTTEAIIGILAAENLQKYNFSKAFIGANGITQKQGFMTTDIDEATIKAIAIDHAFTSYILADSTKFGKVSAVSFKAIDSSAIICDVCKDAEIKKSTVVKEVL